MSQARDFHLGDILSITGERLVAPNGMDGVRAILEFMTGDSLFCHQLPRAKTECEPWLLRQHPFLGSPDVLAELAELELMLESPAGKQMPQALCLGWLSKLTAHYGETFPVEPIPADSHERINPIEELAAMVGPERVIVVAAGDRNAPEIVP